MTTIFGNPGSTELPMLRDFPDDFSYVLGLQELVVGGMADGFAQASGRTTHVNLHTAPGVGNAVGGIYYAQANKSPLLITAGQQVRPQITMEANLTNRDAVFGPQPYVKWAHEPPRAQDVPHAIARAIHHASLPPRGPAFVSIPMDDWDLEADADIAATATAPGGGRIGFPEAHPSFLGVLPPGIGAASETLKEHDLVLVAGSSVFPYYPYIAGPLLAPDTTLVQLTCDPAEAARAPMGNAIVGDVALALATLVEMVGPSERQAPQPRAL